MKEQGKDNSKVFISIYSSSFFYSMIAITIVACLEVFMLVYSILNAEFFGEFLWIYRTFYIVLLTAALIYIALCLYVKKNIGERYKWFTVANPVYAVGFFIWALGITHYDYTVTGTVDTAVFMTFSLIVPLCFYLLPFIYGIIALTADFVMIYMLAHASSWLGQMINTGIFIIFQFVLGVCFLLLKTQLAENIVQEQRNASVDIMTGFGNRRAYVREMEACANGENNPSISYVAIDINGLKGINDSFGHDVGDKLIAGAADCIEQCFGQNGKLFRIGGDEFVVVTTEGGLKHLFSDYEKCMRSWSERNKLELSTSYGHASFAEHPDANIYELARIADSNMMQAKSAYYRQKGIDRRKQRR